MGEEKQMERKGGKGRSWLQRRKKDITKPGPKDLIANGTKEP